MINILAVENNQKKSSVIYSALSDKSRYHLAIVDSGYTAIEAVGLKKFDLIIIERDLSFLSGLKTAQSLRKRLSDNISPFVIIGEKLEEQEVEDFISTGVFDFWQPPLSIQRIRLTVESVANGWRSPMDNLKNYREYLERLGR
ncbi:MAG: response regulator [Ruminococcaceae bacterium]|nr:response regulator [Oscillospiraceae bacterium]